MEVISVILSIIALVFLFLSMCYDSLLWGFLSWIFLSVGLFLVQIVDIFKSIDWSVFMNIEIIKGLVSITTIICICFTVIFCFKYYLQYHYHRDYEEIYDMLADIKAEVSKREKAEKE